MVWPAILAGCQIARRVHLCLWRCGLALALALLQLYGSLKGFRVSWTFILVGHILYTLPFMVRSILAVLAAMDLKTLEEEPQL